MLFLSLVICLFVGIEANAQDVSTQQYKTALGVRLGSPLSISYKTHLDESKAVEIFAGRRGFSGFSWWNVGAAYQIHKPLELGDIENLQYYFGAGASAFFWNYDEVFFDGSTTTVGIQGYLGAQYTIPNSKINITVDWVPTYFINSFISGLSSGYGGIGIRYILN